MNEDVKHNGKLCYSKAHRADWKWNDCEKPTKKGIPEFLIIFFCCRCCCLMHVSVYENCRIQSTSIWYKNHQDILNVTKVMTAYIQEPQFKILVKFQSGHKGLWVPHLILAAWWFIPTTRCSQLLIHNHTELINRLCPLRLLFWCPGLPRKPYSDMWRSNLLPTQFWVRNQAWIWLEKIAALCQHFVA